MYNFFLKNSDNSDFTQLENEPKGWENFSKTIKRNVENKTIVVSYPTELEFWGDGFNILYDALNKNGYDQVFDFRAEKDVVSENDFTVDGQLFLIDTTFDIEKRIATVQIKENGYLARLFGNLRNPIRLPSRETKNGFEMTPTSLIPVFFSNNEVTPTNAGVRVCVDVFEGLKELVTNMSDGNVNLESPALENIFTSDNENTLNRGLVLVRGKELRYGANRPFNTDAQGNKIPEDTYTCKTSFNDLFTAVSRLFNLYLYPNSQSNEPSLIIDQESAYFGDGNVEIESPSERQLQFFQDLFYSRVRTGSSETLFKSGNFNLNFPDFPFVSFKNDEFYINGKSNLDKYLDLTITPYLIDSNIIREVLLTPDGSDSNNPANESFDDKLFLVQIEKRIDGNGNVYGVAMQYNYLNENIYNGGLLTNEVLKRYSLFGSVVENLPDFIFDATLSYVRNQQIDDRSFEYPANISTDLSKSVFTPSFSTVDFDNSTGGVFDFTKYSAPIAGTYSFSFDFTFGVTKLKTRAFDAAGNGFNQFISFNVVALIKQDGEIIGSELVFSRQFNGVGGYAYKDLTLNNVVLDTNQTIELRVESRAYALQRGETIVPIKNSVKWTFFPQKFECTSVPYQKITYEPQEGAGVYRGARIDISNAVNQVQAKNIVDNPEKSIGLRNFVEIGDVKKCWINDLTINYESGEINGSLITNINNE